MPLGFRASSTQEIQLIGFPVQGCIALLSCAPLALALIPNCFLKAVVQGLGIQGSGFTDRRLARLESSSKKRFRGVSRDL